MRYPHSLLFENKTRTERLAKYVWYQWDPLQDQPYRFDSIKTAQWTNRKHDNAGNQKADLESSLKREWTFLTSHCTCFAFFALHVSLVVLKDASHTANYIGTHAHPVARKPTRIRSEYKRYATWNTMPHGQLYVHDVIMAPFFPSVGTGAFSVSITTRSNQCPRRGKTHTRLSQNSHRKLNPSVI